MTTWEYAVRCTAPGKIPLILPQPGENSREKALAFAARLATQPGPEGQQVEIVRRPADGWQPVPEDGTAW